MDTLFDLKAPKKPTNLSVNSDLLAKSRALNVNLSAVLEQALAEKLAESAALHWEAENRNAIRAYNRFVEENGCFSDEYRPF